MLTFSNVYRSLWKNKIRTSICSGLIASRIGFLRQSGLSFLDNTYNTIYKHRTRKQSESVGNLNKKNHIYHRIRNRSEMLLSDRLADPKTIWFTDVVQKKQDKNHICPPPFDANAFCACLRKEAVPLYTSGHPPCSRARPCLLSTHLLRLARLLCSCIYFAKTDHHRLCGNQLFNRENSQFLP